MRRTPWTLLWTAAARAMLSVAASATTVRADTRDARADSIDAYVTRKMRAQRVPGVAWAVVENGRIAIAGAQGFANLETRTPVTTASVFDLASLTKPFTAVAVLLLVEDGKLALETPITNLLPDAPAAWRGITVRHLLTHTAGLPEELDAGCDGVPLMDVSAAQAFAAVARAPLLFAAGDKAQYSDPGYVLLGMIVEKASGLAYRDFVQQRIFDRLAMQQSSILDQWRIVENRVAPYAIRRGELLRGRRDWQIDAPAAFGIWSTVGDLAKFAAALLDATLLADSSRARMWTPAVLRDGRPALVQGQPYGLGWSIGEVRGRPAVWHGGFSGTLLLHLPEDRLTVVVLTNLDNASGPHASLLARGIAGRFAPAYRSPDLLSPAPDPSPRTARRVRALFDDLAAGRASPVMTAAHREAYAGWPPRRREEISRRLGTLASIAYLGCDDVRGRRLQLGDPIARICYYRCDLGAASVDATLWMTAAGSVSALRLDPH